MAKSMNDILHPKGEAEAQPEFPNAPAGWTKEVALSSASKETLKLGDDHWALVNALQEYFTRHENSSIKVRELSDALDEKFHSKGGIKYLFELFPDGPIAQGCRIAGLTPPSGSTDKGFGSVR